jgi:hypothetical protein
MVTGSVMMGRREPGVRTFTPAIGMLKSMVSGPAWALALMMDCRREPAPASRALVTV